MGTLQAAAGEPGKVRRIVKRMGLTLEMDSVRQRGNTCCPWQPVARSHALDTVKAGKVRSFHSCGNRKMQRIRTPNQARSLRRDALHEGIVFTHNRSVVQRIFCDEIYQSLPHDASKLWRRFSALLLGMHSAGKFSHKSAGVRIQGRSCH